MIGFVVVFVGAGIGGSIRHAMNIHVARRMGTHFPYHTFSINIIGSLVMGLISGWFGRHLEASPNLPLFLMTGILGGFTTFSAFSRSPSWTCSSPPSTRPSASSNCCATSTPST